MPWDLSQAIMDTYTPPETTMTSITAALYQRYPALGILDVNDPDLTPQDINAARPYAIAGLEASRATESVWVEYRSEVLIKDLTGSLHPSWSLTTEPEYDNRLETYRAKVVVRLPITAEDIWQLYTEEVEPQDASCYLVEIHGGARVLDGGTYHLVIQG